MPRSSVYVVDTDVISRSSPLSRERDRVSSWLQMHVGLTFVSTATLAELQFGASRLRLRGATRQAEALAAWVDTVMTTYLGRMLEIGMEVGLRTGEMLARAEKAGSTRASSTPASRRPPTFTASRW